MSVSLAEARRIALRAQGFTTQKNEPPKSTLLLKTIRQIGLLQLDSVNVVVRSHYLPLFSRLGPYDTKALDKASCSKPRKLFEYWGHEASLIPVECHQLFRWRMDEARAGRGTWAGPSKLARERPDFIRAVLDEIRDRGAIGAGELTQGGKSSGTWWGWSEGKRAVEYLFWTGQLTSAGRRGFERLYDLPERVIPDAVLGLPDPARDDAQRTLVEIAAKAFGIATEADLRDYFRLSLADAKARTQELVEQGVLQPVAVEGWKQQAYLHREAKASATDACALIAPFDSLIWARQRTERLFDFHYRLAFYTPKHKRTQGYYVMPFLLGDRLVARVDLKSDRKGDALQVLGGHAEHGVDVTEVARPLRQSLNELASWLGLGRVTIKSRTELANAVRRA
ncbi:MAG: crosslink repair DNA glycosylase YcaQ family protein [Micropepsaceae bacterium]